MARRAVPCRPRAAERGAAMTELAILLFPYAMCLLGVTLMAMLGLGRQEAAKAVGWYASNPDATSVTDHYFLRFPGRPSAVKADPYTPFPDLHREEPVLPYGDTVGDQLDIAAAFKRAGLSVASSVEDGELVLNVQKTNIGQKLLDLGIVLSWDDVVDAYKVADPEDLPNLPSPPLHPEIADQMAEILGSPTKGWLGYARAEITNYRYSLSSLASDRSVGAGEGGDGGVLDLRDDLRREWNVEGEIVSDRDPPANADRGPLAAFETVYRRTDGDRGRHDDTARNDVKLEDMGDYVRVEGDAVLPLRLANGRLPPHFSSLSRDLMDRAYNPGP